MSPRLQPASPVAPLPQRTSELGSRCSVMDGQARMQLGLYIPEIKGLGACWVAAGLGCSRSTLSWVQSAPCTAGPRLACSEQPLPDPACLSHERSPVQAFSASNSFHPHGSTLQPWLPQDHVV